MPCRIPFYAYDGSLLGTVAFTSIQHLHKLKTEDAQQHRYVGVVINRKLLDVFWRWSCLNDASKSINRLTKELFIRKRSCSSLPHLLHNYFLVVKMAKKRKPQPIAPPPQSSTLRSRKRARQVTTLFHKYTQELDSAIDRAREGGCSEVQLSSLDGAGNKSKCIQKSISPEHKVLLGEVKKWKDKITEIGGREGEIKHDRFALLLFIHLILIYTPSKFKKSTNEQVS